MAISGVFLTMSNIYGTNYLIIIGRERSLRNLTMYASLLGFVIAIPLIYYGGYMGAVAIIVFVRMLLGVGSYLLAYNCKKNICKKSAINKFCMRSYLNCLNGFTINGIFLFRID